MPANMDSVSQDLAKIVVFSSALFSGLFLTSFGLSANTSAEKTGLLCGGGMLTLSSLLYGTMVLRSWCHAPAATLDEPAAGQLNEVHGRYV